MFSPRHFLIALQFLTILPVRIQGPLADKAIGHSLLYYPLVGLIIGVLLSTCGWGLGDAPALVAAALLLTVWVLLTGALHLDGLADSADAWIGGLGDRDKTLAIMKDPYCGPAAVVALVLVLLIKFTTLQHLITTERWEVLLLAPVLGRTLLVLLFLSTPYVRSHGLGTLLAEHLPRFACRVVILVTLMVALLFIDSAGFWLLVTLFGVFFVLRSLMLRRIGGTTGDTAGALVEITEAAVLLTAVL